MTLNVISKIIYNLKLFILVVQSNMVFIKGLLTQILKILVQT